MTTYKEELCLAMNALSDDPNTCVIGYNTLHGRCGGTLNGFDPKRITETPLAENCMAGVAIGMSLDGWLPLLWLERFDFAMCCADAIVNHLDKIYELSSGIHKPAVIIRVAVGNKTVPLFTGATHCQNFAEAFRNMVNFPVLELTDKEQISGGYSWALETCKKGQSTMLVEFRDLYTS